jgi:hypothetical protein
MARIGGSLPLSIVIVCAVLAPSVAFSQADLFQSDPGPAPPAAVEAPRAKPVSRLVPRVAPKREEPPATAPVVAPQPSSSAAKFDGIWVGPFNCGAMGRLPAIQFEKTAVVKDGRIEIVSGAAAGTPGFWSVAGTVASDGSIELSGETISAGRPGTPPAGQHVMHRFSGRVVGDQFTADDLEHSNRGCKLTMSRRR